jgi:hypothetical protein
VRAEMVKCLFIVLYFFVALVASGLYGWYAVKIFLPEIDPRKRGSAADISIQKRKPFCWHMHQMWLNFAGSLVGWLCLWFVGKQLVEKAPTDFGWGYALLALVAFVGVTGYLPSTAVGIVQAIGTLIDKFAGLIPGAKKGD